MINDITLLYTEKKIERKRNRSWLYTGDKMYYHHTHSHTQRRIKATHTHTHTTERARYRLSFFLSGLEDI